MTYETCDAPQYVPPRATEEPVSEPESQRDPPLRPSPPGPGG